jgi:GNAT superfamily N-acetyltransferase
VIYKVRRAAEDEIEECEQLFTRFFPGCIKPRQDSVWWVAIELAQRDEIVAFASARLIEDGSAIFNSAGVLREHRGHGLQRRLIRARVAWAKRQGCPHAVTYTATDNATSANSLIASGFKQLELDKPWFPNCAHCESAGFVYWRRSLGA